jgi:hypothetical protein
MDHGKFQLSLAQALMDRPLPVDFGMQLSRSAGCRGRTSGMTEIDTDVPGVRDDF